MVTQEDIDRWRRDPVIANIASILDHPSVYMGGPSRRSTQLAARIVQYLEDAGLIEQRAGRSA